MDTTYSSEKVSISDVKGVEIYQGSISGPVPAGERKALSTVLIPNQSASGAALVSVDIVDDATSKHVSLSKIIRITGLSATLDERTDQDIYLETEAITGISTIANGPFDILNGRLRVAIKKKQPAGSGKFSVLLPEQWWSFERAQSVAAGSDGSVYVADIGKRTIQKFDADGNFVLEWGGSGSGDGQFGNLFSVSAASDGSVYVADSGNNRIQKFDSRGVFIERQGRGRPAHPQPERRPGPQQQQRRCVMISTSTLPWLIATVSVLRAAAPAAAEAPAGAAALAHALHRLAGTARELYVAGTPTTRTRASWRTWPTPGTPRRRTSR